MITAPPGEYAATAAAGELSGLAGVHGTVVFVTAVSTVRVVVTAPGGWHTLKVVARELVAITGVGWFTGCIKILLKTKMQGWKKISANFKYSFFIL